jgi:hypothetical protein
MRRAHLQFVKNCVTDGLRVAPQMGVPEPQRFNASRFQKRLSCAVMMLRFRKTVLASVQFNVQPRFLAKEIKIVDANRMLASEFVAVETAVPQPAPDELFRPGFQCAELAGAFDVGHDRNLIDQNALGKLVFLVRPHPGPLLRGEGEASHVSGFADACPANSVVGILKRAADVRKSQLRSQEFSAKLFCNVEFWLQCIDRALT